MALIKSQRLQQSFVLAKLRQLASPRFNRVKMSIMAVPSSKAFKLFIFLPVAGFMGYHFYTYIAQTIVYDENSQAGGQGGGRPSPSDNNCNGGSKGEKSWYQISKVQGSEGSYTLFGLEFQSPRMVFINGVRGYMGGVIKEVLADDKVNKQGLDFLDRAFRHP